MLLRPAPRCCCLFACRSGPRRELSSKVTVDPDGPRARPPAPPTSCTTSRSRATVLYEKAVCVHNIHCCGCAEGPDPPRGMADALGGGRRRSGRCGSTSPPPSPHAGCSLCAWTDQACVAGAPRPRHRRSSRRQPCRSARGLTSRGRSPWSSGRTRRSMATAVGACVRGSSAMARGIRAASQSPRSGRCSPRVSGARGTTTAPDGDGAWDGGRPTAEADERSN